MTYEKSSPSSKAADDASPRFVTRSVILIVVMLCLGLAAGVGYLFWKNRVLSTGSFTLLTPTVPPAPTAQSKSVPAEPPSPQSIPEAPLKREWIDRLLNELDRANREKDIDGMLHLIAPDATVTIHMKQGTQQQTVGLTRDEYRKTLAMTFAFPSANDFTRTHTAVSLAADERSAKVSFKSTETLRVAGRDLIVEGEETLVCHSRDGKAVITSLEQIVPGDSM